MQKEINMRLHKGDGYQKEKHLGQNTEVKRIANKLWQTGFLIPPNTVQEEIGLNYKRYLGQTGEWQQLGTVVRCRGFLNLESDVFSQSLLHARVQHCNERAMIFVLQTEKVKHAEVLGLLWYEKVFHRVSELEFKYLGFQYTSSGQNVMFPDLGPCTIPECIITVLCKNFPEDLQEQSTLLFCFWCNPTQKVEAQYFPAF